ncbi:hypothetical protein WKW79_36425 [Variovorax robiniae]|uniref:DUF4156 domain-containing protein n=1 Tax=Variovorax robiniae TaxID=1836199 RepID=A0ABU8XK30_9BURK
MKVIALLAPLSLLAACATTHDPAALKVRQIDPPGASSPCKFIGVVEVTGSVTYWSMAEAKRDVLALTRNEVARRGGNAYVPTATFVERGLSPASAQADAYACP